MVVYEKNHNNNNKKTQHSGIRYSGLNELDLNEQAKYYYF